MSLAKTAPFDSLRFGRFELRARDRRLLRDGVELHLGARALDVLVVLAEHAGDLVNRGTLIERVWPRVVVEDNNLTVQINALRRLLGKDLITTVPGYGYRLAMPAAAAAPVVATPPPAAAETLKSNLPCQVKPLVARSPEVSELHALLDRARLVSIVGAGGVGKTLLAQHLALQRQHHYRHGVCFVALGGVHDADLLPSQLACALGLSAGGPDPMATLCRELEALELLLVVDNAEHLLDPLAGRLSAVLQAAPGVQVLVTSQAPLRLAAEQVFRLGPLALPDAAQPVSLQAALDHGAIALFVERARAADARFALGEADLPHVVALCRALDGLPLALELAASRAPLFGVRQLAQMAGDRFHAQIGNPDRFAPERQQTLRAALDWSWQLLSPRERCVLRRLAVTRGSTDAALIQRVVANHPGDDTLDEWAVLDALGILVDRSWLAPLHQPGGELRYQLLDMPQAYAHERLAESGERDALRARHAEAMAERFDAILEERTLGLVPGAAEVHPRRQHDAELDNGQQALAWARANERPLLVARLLPGLYWATPHEAAASRRALAVQCEALADGVAQPRALSRLLAVAAAQWLMVSPARSSAAAERAVSAARQSSASEGDVRWLYLTLCLLADARAGAADPAGAAATLAQAVAIESAEWPPALLSRRWQAEMRLADGLGDKTRMLVAARQQVALDRASGGPLSWTVANLVHAELAAGHTQTAILEGRELVRRLQGSRRQSDLIFPRLNLCAALLVGNELAEARELCRSGWAQAVRHDFHAAWADYLALLSALEGRYTDAAVLCGYADALYALQQGPRESNEAAASARCHELVRAHVDDHALPRLSALGAGMHPDDAIALATRT